MSRPNNNLTHTITYDTDDRISSIQLGGLLVRNYTYDAVNNITKIINGVASSKTQNFTYDNVYRLTNASGIYGYQVLSV